MSNSLLSTVFGLIAATTWGAGDYFGGVATKKDSPFIVVLFAHFISLIILIIAVLLLREPLPSFRGLLWGGLAGLFGGGGLILLYSALASGKMAIAAPISALVAAAIPLGITCIFKAIPGPYELFGALLALIAIWILSGGGSQSIYWNDIQLPLLAGVAFGFFFIFLNQSANKSVLFPLIAVRIVSISALTIYALFNRNLSLPVRQNYFHVFMSGVLDTIGNGAFALSAQVGQVEYASIVSSLYPGATVVLAWILLHEKINRKQLFGVSLAVVAIMMMNA